MESMQYAYSQSQLRILFHQFQQESLNPHKSLAWYDSLLQPFQLSTDSPPIIVIDQGGTNYRVGLVSFQNSHPYYHEPIISLTAKNTHESVSDFYDWFIGQIPPRWLETSKNIAWIFSYPHEVVKNGQHISAVMTKSTKNFSVPGLVGENIGAHLLERLSSKGIQITRLVILNDTVATMLAEPSADCGLVVATGGNIASYHPTLPHIRNVEAGNFNPIVQLVSPLQSYAQTLERQTTGKYVPEIFLATIKKNISATSYKWLTQNHQVQTAFMNEFVSGKHRNFLSTDELKICMSIATQILTTSAQLWGTVTAACLALALPEKKNYTVATTGALALNTPGYLAMIEETIVLHTAVPTQCKKVTDSLVGGARAVLSL